MFNAASISQFTSFQTATSATQVALSTLPWHLRPASPGNVGIDAASVWAQYTGRGVKVGVFDDGLDASSTGLRTGAVLAGGTLGSGDGSHGTAVAGIIGADPGARAAGVAFDSSITSHKILGLSGSGLATEMAKQSNYDIANHSWGWGKAFLVDSDNGAFTRFIETLDAAADHGRGGLGTIQVLAAGNFRSSGIDTNASQFTNDRHVVTVTAVTSEGRLTDYASAGASVLVAAASRGGLQGGIRTTDMAGAKGYSIDDFTSNFGGTSAAAPQVSGVVALMLEANPNLGWRDVKEILALSAQKLPGIAMVNNGAENWNGGGIGFSNDIGFGLVDARAAVRLAETWLWQQTSANEVSTSASMNTRTLVKDNGVTEFKLSLKSGVAIETIELDLGLTHSDVSQISVALVSPDGTVSQLLPRIANSGAIDGWTLTSNAFLGEDSGGQWTVRVTDHFRSGIGAVSSLELKAFGSQTTADKTFFYTNDFSVVADAGRATITDKLGSHTVNAAAVSSDSVIDLSAGRMVIDGITVGIATGVAVTRAFSGDGNDILRGSSRSELLSSGRGADSIYGGAGDDILVGGLGNDWLDGGAGIDVALLHGSHADWILQRDAFDFRALNAGLNETDTLRGVERIAFSDALVAFDTDGLAGFGYRVYQAAFDRAPDREGLSYWVKQLDKGMSVTEVAARFIDSNEFRSLYGAETTTHRFVDKLYEHVLQRSPDEGGRAFWLDQINGGVYGRAEVLARFSDSTENRTNVAADISNGIMLGHEYFIF